jgi:hypothetical protein
VTDFTLDKGVVNIVLNRLFDGSRFHADQARVFYGDLHYFGHLAGIRMGAHHLPCRDAPPLFRNSTRRPHDSTAPDASSKRLHITIPTIAPHHRHHAHSPGRKDHERRLGKNHLLYNPAIYEQSRRDFLLRFTQGLQDMKFSFSSAVGLFNSAMNFILLVSVNKVSKMVQGTSLW